MRTYPWPWRGWTSWTSRRNPSWSSICPRTSWRPWPRSSSWSKRFLPSCHLLVVLLLTAPRPFIADMPPKETGNKWKEVGPIVCLQCARLRVRTSAKPERQRNLFRAGCRSAIYVLPHIYFDRARTPKEGRSYCPTLCFYIQDNDVQGDTHMRVASLHRFLELLLLRTANARQRRAHQSDASAGSFSRLGAKFPLTP